MPFSLSFSGLDSASRAIDVIGNNIANAQTIGFKTSKARFADSSSGGASAAIINQQFTQGSPTQSDNPLDMAITGLGFFRLDNRGAITYSRDGQFQLSYDDNTPDKRALVNRTGLNVTGYLAEYSADPKGVIVTSSAPQNITVNPFMPAMATGKVLLGATLDARVAPPSVTPFAANNRMTYTNTAGLGVFDSAGVTHELRMYFAKSSSGPNAWDLYTTLDNGSSTGPVALNFDTKGLMGTTMPLASQTYALSGGGSVSVALDLSGTVQYGSAFSVDSISQDGYGNGAINSSNGFTVGSDGIIQAFYSNGQSRKVAQIVLANFVNPNGLISLGDNQWKENQDPVSGSGSVILDTPGRTGLVGGKPMGMGTLQGGAKEQSNVDLGTELVALIEQQRNYQASAQTLKIQDQILQNLMNASRP
ncbi:MAG: flagellar hook protein FlgE [Rhodocyclales bacterium]|nr:flagellar hook protein FlgE [Rhodocyclales bacterium]